VAEDAREMIAIVDGPKCGLVPDGMSRDVEGSARPLKARHVFHPAKVARRSGPTSPPCDVVALSSQGLLL
jgi:hypothetical protein